MKTKDGRSGGNLRGDSHDAPSGGIKTVNVDTNEQLLVEGGELVLTKGVSESKEKHEFDGEKKTPLEIASELNQNAGGIPLAKKGELIGGEKQKQTQTKTINNEINDVLSGKSEVRNGDAIQATLIYIRRNEGSGKKSNREIAELEEKILTDFISEKNLLYTGKLSTDNRFGGGTEQNVYKEVTPTEFVIKTNNLIYYNTWTQYLTNLLLHNYFFPDTSYQLIGFHITKSGKFLPVVKQPFIEENQLTNLKHVEDFLLNKGFERTNSLMNVYENKELGIIIGDLNETNVLTKNGFLYFIDTKFYINKSAEEGKYIKKEINFASDGAKKNTMENLYIVTIFDKNIGRRANLTIPLPKEKAEKRAEDLKIQMQNSIPKYQFAEDIRVEESISADYGAKIKPMERREKVKYEITAEVPTVYQLSNLTAFGMGFKEKADGSLYASRIFETEEKAKTYLRNRAEIWNDKYPSETKQGLDDMYASIENGELQLGNTTAFINEIEEEEDISEQQYESGGKLPKSEFLYLKIGNLIKDKEGNERCRIAGHSKDGIDVVAYSSLPTTLKDPITWSFNDFLLLMDGGKIQIENCPYNKEDNTHNFLLRKEIAVIKLLCDVAHHGAAIEKMRGECDSIKLDYDSAKTDYEKYKANVEATMAGMEAMKGGVRIHNQYKGKNVEEIWNELTEEQRQHFLHDHFPNDPMGGFRLLKWNDLNSDVQNKFMAHVMVGQYARGGKVGRESKMKVKFLYNEKNNDLFAYFPEEKDTATTFMTYSHIGQHSGASPEYASESREATFYEYSDLKKELESIGYNLLVLNKSKADGDQMEAMKGVVWSPPLIRWLYNKNDKAEWYLFWITDMESKKKVPMSDAYVYSKDYGAAVDDFIAWWNNKNNGKGYMNMTIGYPVVQGRVADSEELKKINSSGKYAHGEKMGKEFSIKKLTAESKFWRARLRSPRGVEKCATPEWAKNISESVIAGSKITTCKFNDKWHPQVILIPKKGVKKKEARKFAEEIAEKLNH